MGETRVDLQHLLEDLRDAYADAVEETILTEIIANSLDSGATRLDLVAEPEQVRLTILDDGAGMSRSVLRRYHDVAASTKTRGEGIGFAGVGIKLGLLLSEEVLTETRRGSTHVATSWRLASRKRAPWRWVEAPGRVARHGTAVSLKLQNPLSPLLDGGFITAAVQRHFAPLLDGAFTEILATRYPAAVQFFVGGVPVRATASVLPRAPLALRIGRRRKPGAVGFLLRADAPLPEEQRGIAVSSLGKVIKRGWDWLGLSPAGAERVGGLIEVPALAACLTLNKADFLRTGERGATYLTYRRALQEAVSTQLAAWGSGATDTDDAQQRRRVRPLERDLASVLVDLADEFPLLSSLVERQPGGQRSLPVGRADPVGDALAAAAGLLTPGGAAPPESPESPPPVSPPSDQPAPESGPALPGIAQPVNSRRGPRRPIRFGLSIQFESRPDDPSLGRLVESTVWINNAHPAYRRAALSRSEGYHLAVTVALVLAPLAVEAAQSHAFVSAFLRHWGESAERKGRRA